MKMLRVLMVARTFLPEHRAGMENHSFQLAQYLLSRGHQVGMLYRILDQDGEEYQLREGDWEGLSIFQIVRNGSNPLLNPFPFYDRQVELAFERIMAAYQPDLVHIHHLSDLSASLPATARRHGLAVISTLHDFWPICFMSHLRMPDGTLCPGPDEGLRCIECLWQQWRAAYEPVNIRARIRELGFWSSLRRAPRFLVDFAAARLAVGGDALASTTLRTQMVSLTARNHYMRKALMDCDLLISPSQFLIDKFVEWGIPASQFRQIRNSVPATLQDLRSAAKEPGIRTTFGFIGSLYPPKGVHVLVDAFLRLNAEGAALRIWGQPPDTSALEYAAQLRSRATGIPNLVFEGGFPPDSLSDVLRQIDVLVLPSVWCENNPLVILEAFAAGIPVLAGDAGGMAELVDHDVNGLQFRMGDPQDLADKMRMMLAGDRLARYRASIKPPWSHEEMGAVVEQLYFQLLEGRGRLGGGLER
jgi:glycosyltransferase involved in cell wall biosynthesis